MDFNINLCDELPGHIQNDPTRIRQCLINLINNAIKFTKEGHVHVNVSLEERNDLSYIRFDIEDTGIGIAPERQQKVFESFTQTDGSTTCRKYGGTGLGLTITQQLTELLGGTVALSSEVDKGSVFTILIPTGLDATDHPLLDESSQENLTCAT